MSRGLLFTQLATTLPLAGLIWTIQIVHYPLFAAVGGDVFSDYHAAHSRSISLLVVPFMLIELVAALAWLRWPPDGGGLTLPLLGAALIAVIWISTFALQVPIHGALGGGLDPALVDRLVTTNWLRTLAWSGRSALLLVVCWRQMPG